MLSSPGNSPRQILSSPSSSPPSTPHLNNSQTLTLADVGRVSNPVAPSSQKRRRSQTVLDEDTYVAAIEKIIERDYFPDLPKLHDRLDWLEAVRSGDPMQIRDTQLKIVERRRGRLSGHENFVTPTTSTRYPFETPLSTVAPMSARSNEGLSQRHPFGSDLSGGGSEGDNMGNEHSESLERSSMDTNMSLDDFLKRHTSEDNESFAKILESVNKRRREKYRYLHNVELASMPAALKMGDEDPNRKTDGYGTSGQPESTLESWGHTPKNLLMYGSANREEVALTKTEREERVKALTKEIKQPNTRFHGNVFESITSFKVEDNPVAILYTPVAGSTPAFSDRDPDRAKRKYDLEDLRRTPQMMLLEEKNDGSRKGGTAGYSFVRTPSPAPGVDESPFITWGEIEGTPLRLEEEDTPVGIGGSGDGPHFKIPQPPARDVRAYNLSRDAARNLREKSKLYQRPPRAPTPSLKGSASPSFSLLSPAAQKFVRNAMAKSCNSVDATLRASYQASTTPGTPKMARNAVKFEREGSFSYGPSSFREGSISARSPTPDA